MRKTPLNLDNDRLLALHSFLGNKDSAMLSTSSPDMNIYLKCGISLCVAPDQKEKVYFFYDDKGDLDDADTHSVLCSSSRPAELPYNKRCRVMSPDPTHFIKSIARVLMRAALEFSDLLAFSDRMDWKEKKISWRCGDTKYTTLWAPAWSLGRDFPLPKSLAIHGVLGLAFHVDQSSVVFAVSKREKVRGEVELVYEWKKSPVHPSASLTKFFGKRSWDADVPFQELTPLFQLLLDIREPLMGALVRTDGDSMIRDRDREFFSRQHEIYAAEQKARGGRVYRDRVDPSMTTGSIPVYRRTQVLPASLNFAPGPHDGFVTAEVGRCRGEDLSAVRRFVG
jgi:hypothetical protein